MLLELVPCGWLSATRSTSIQLCVECQNEGWKAASPLRAVHEVWVTARARSPQRCGARMACAGSEAGLG